MKNIVLILGCLALLTACIPYAVQPPNPYSQRAMAEGAIQATQAALSEQVLAATIEAARTAQAAQAEIDLLQAQAAATQQAIAALQMQAEGTRQAQIYQITLTAQAAQATATAYTVMQSTQQAFPVQATSTQAALNEIVREDRARELRARWESFVIPFQALLPSLLWFTVLILLVIGSVFAYRRLLPVLEMRLRTVSRGQGADPLFLFPDLLVDPSRSFGPALRLDAGHVESLGHAPTPDLQAGVTGRAQAVEAVRALSPEYSNRRLAQYVANTALQTQPAAPAPRISVTETVALPRQAPWRMLEDWRGGALPLGLSNSGLVLADPEANPHLLFAGATGSGKTRYGLRPLIASALADGWQVTIFDRSGLDFLPFRQHPNAHLILLNDPAQAVGYLQNLYAEILRRFEQLREAGISTWGRLPDAGPRLLSVMDEFSNLADTLPNNERKELWRQARMIAAEGRKAGVHLALALQDPTHESLDLRIRRNAAPVSFRVKDQDASRVVLGSGGAESLPERQFLAVLSGALVRGVAFSPDDAEINAFLGAHPTPVLPNPEWLNAPVISPPQINHGEDQTVEKIRALRAGGASMNAIQDQVFGYRGGAAYAAVKAALEGDTTTQ